MFQFYRMSPKCLPTYSFTEEGRGVKQNNKKKTNFPIDDIKIRSHQLKETTLYFLG